MSAGVGIDVPATVLGGSPAREKARTLLGTLTPDEQRAMVRACLWRAAQTETSHQIVLGDVPVVGPEGKLGHLADLDIEEMVATVIEHSTFARARHARQADAYAALAEKEYEALPQSFKEKTL